MDVTKLNNPYEKGSIVHQNFHAALSHFCSQSDDSLEKELKANRKRAKEFLTYSESELDSFERDCLAIETILNSRKH